MPLNRLILKELSETEYRNKITYVSYIWALFVIMLHTYNIDTYAPKMEAQNYLWQTTQVIENTVGNVAGIAVPGFFFLSGFLFYQNFEPNKLLEKWKNRFRTYVIPYLIWTILPYFFYVTVTHSPLHRYMNMDAVELSVHRMLQVVLTSEFNVLWFLKYLIIYTACAPAFYLVLKNRKVPVGVLTIIALIVIQGHLGVINIFYVLGCYVGLNHRGVLHCHHLICDKISMVALICVIAVMALFGKTNRLSQAEIGIVLFLFWNVANFLPLAKHPQWYVRVSFFMYCTHSVILESIEKILFVLGHNKVCMPLVDYIVAPVCTLAIIYIAAYILKNYCQPVWKVVTGERG